MFHTLPSLSDCRSSSTPGAPSDAPYGSGRGFRFEYGKAWQGVQSMLHFTGSVRSGGTKGVADNDGTHDDALAFPEPSRPSRRRPHRTRIQIPVDGAAHPYDPAHHPSKAWRRLPAHPHFARRPLRALRSPSAWRPGCTRAGNASACVGSGSLSQAE